MIRSMTAFARQECENSQGVLVWEMRSLNHRYLDIAIRLPEELRMLEPSVRERVTARLGRGKVECALRYRLPANLQAAINLDEDNLVRLLDACRVVEGRHGNVAPINAGEVLRWPGVVREVEVERAPLMELALSLLDLALDELIEMREREGRQIREILEQRCTVMSGLVSRVRQRLPDVHARIRDKLLSRLAGLEEPLDPGRLEQELVFLAQKMDVDEELDRLDGHIAEVRRVLEISEPVGRRLDFLMQEFNREANTLGSKSADADTTRVSVELKVLIEQMREQVQNAE